jgi:hypothetical protein
MTAEVSTITSAGRARHTAVRQGRRTARIAPKAAAVLHESLERLVALFIELRRSLKPLKALAQRGRHRLGQCLAGLLRKTRGKCVSLGILDEEGDVYLYISLLLHYAKDCSREVARCHRTHGRSYRDIVDRSRYRGVARRGRNRIENRYYAAANCRRRLATCRAPIAAAPAIMRVHVAGSGTARVSTEANTNPLSVPGVRLKLAAGVPS